MKRFHIISQLLSLIFLPLNFLLFSCGGSEVLFQPDYENNIYRSSNLSNSNIKVIKVNDNRILSKESVKPNSAGTARVGGFNRKVPYNLDVSVNNFVQKSVNTILDTSKTGNNFVPVTINLDTFLVFEKHGLMNESGHFKCVMNFSYPLNSETTNVINTLSLREFSSGIDVTDYLGDLIYQGIYQCTEQFMKYYNDSAIYIVPNESTLPKFTLDSSKPKETVINAYRRDEFEKNSLASLRITYLSGDILKSSYGAHYITFKYDKEQQFLHGVGYGVNIITVENVSSNLKGSFFGFGGKYVPRYYFLSSMQGPCLTGGVTLMLGTERIGNNTNFFFGPILEEAFGLKLGPILVEAGLFQILLLGSDLLPSDLGYSFGFGFQF
ncbi:MAG: hypothetical protein HZB41_14010 [Ignavibacteriae bacterium]|nr:hypothetical protein [Ignavibacteriota bacterium]